MINLTRTAVCLSILLNFLNCQIVQAQQKTDPPSKVPCIHASAITQEDDTSGAGKAAWTTAASTQDGLFSITYCGVFKDGPTSVRRIAVSDLDELPTGFDAHRKYGEMVGEKIQVRDLPPGFTVYQGMAFEIVTEAVPNMRYLTFRVPSVRSEEEFSKLTILYLDENPLLPGALEWRNHYSQLDIPKPDFKARTLSAVFNFASVFHHRSYVGRVVVASFNRAEYEKSPLDLGISSVVGPPYVKAGETFTYSVTIFNGGGNPVPAADVVFYSSMNNGEFVSATATQGRCRESVNSSDVTVCDLGEVPGWKKVVINITVKARADGMMDYLGEAVFTTSNIVSARAYDYTPENNHYESRGTIIRH